MDNTNKQNNKINKLSLIWGFFISFVILALLSMIVLAIAEIKNTPIQKEKEKEIFDLKKELDEAKELINKKIEKAIEQESIKNQEIEKRIIKAYESKSIDDETKKIIDDLKNKLLEKEKENQELLNELMNNHKEDLKIFELKNEKIKELEKENKELKNKISELEKEIKRLLKEIERLKNKNQTTTSSHIEVINGVKHHHYIVPDSAFDKKGEMKNSCELFKNMYRKDLEPNLMQQFIQKINPNYNGWICWSPSFNEEEITSDIQTEIKYPPKDLVGIFFDKGERYLGNNEKDDWDKYTFDEVIKETNGAENVYYFWRTPEISDLFYKCVISSKEKKINKQDPESNKPRCPSFAKLLTQEDIDNLNERS
ncbi:MAG: hypothetical protein Q8901_02390 [Candidatus Phytoplasma stylosanthis]|nr:hypothetical protein [Candidatus Phytoplasma stylosanthis]